MSNHILQFKPEKVIFILHEPLIQRFEDIYCIQELIEGGLSIEYWDISQICNPNIVLPNEIKRDYVLKINNYRDLHKKVKENKYNIFIIEIFFDYQNTRLWHLFTKYKLNTIKFERFANNNLGSFTKEEKAMNKKGYSKLQVLYRMIRTKIFNLLIRFKYISKYKYLITSKNEGDLKVNHPDYDLYLKSKNNKPSLDYKYIVFSDIGFGRHPDELYFKGNIIHNNNEIWNKKLCNLFNLIEEQYKLPVVIAGHPKVDYKEEDFEGRSIIKYDTINLTQNAEYVITPLTNSISFSAIFNKSLLLVTTEEFYKAYGPYLSQLSRVLNLKINKIEELQENINFQKIPEDTRISYIKGFLNPNYPEERLTSERLLEFIRENFIPQKVTEASY